MAACRWKNLGTAQIGGQHCLEIYCVKPGWIRNFYYTDGKMIMYLKIKFHDNCEKKNLNLDYR